MHTHAVFKFSLDNPTCWIWPLLAWKFLSSYLPLFFLSIHRLFFSLQLTLVHTMVPSESVWGFDTRSSRSLWDQDHFTSQAGGRAREEEWLRNKERRGEEGEIRVKDGAFLKKCHIVKVDISRSSRSRAGRKRHPVYLGFSLYYTIVDCPRNDKEEFH